jgi:hypothetical protein
MQRNWKKQPKKEEKNEKSATNSLLHNHTYHKIKIKEQKVQGILPSQFKFQELMNQNAAKF